MKKQFQTALFLLFVLLGLAAQAQNYQPFRKNRTYYFTARDSVYSMRIDTAKVVGGDSVFVFNPTVKPGIIRTGPQYCVGTTTYYHAQTNNQFGHWMKELPNGDYIFHTAQGYDFLIKTQATNSWAVNSSLGLFASVSSAVSVTFNGVTDLVKTISLNNGTRIRLSQNYGFVEAPNFMSFVPNSDFKRRTLVQQRIPVKKLNASPILRFYNYQPGDKFSFFTDSSLAGLRYQFWDQYEILNRTNSYSSLGDESTYTITHQRLAKSWWWGFGTTGPINTVLSPTNTYNLSVASSDYFPEGELTTNGFHEDDPWYSLGTIHLKTGPSAIFNQRETTTLIMEHYSNTCNTFLNVQDHGRRFEYTEGLGKTFDYYDYLTNTTTRILQAYVKGSETYGIWRSLSQIMATAEEIAPQPFSVFPNPFTSDLSLKLSSTFKGENATVSVTNLLGQEIFRSNLHASPNQEIKLNLPEMAKGIYTLQLTENGKTHTSRLVKE